MLKIINEEKKILNSTVPILVKISPDIQEDDLPTISELLLKHEVDIIIISNSIICGHSFNNIFN